MSKVTIQIRIEELIKEEVEKILHQSGINLSEAIRGYMAQIILHGGIPYKGYISGTKIKKTPKPYTPQMLVPANDTVPTTGIYNPEEIRLQKLRELGYKPYK